MRIYYFPFIIFHLSFSICHSKKGQSLIEVVIALAVVVALAISLVTTTLITQRTSRQARNNTEASKLVQQNIEQIRAFRDRKGFAAFPGDGACYVLIASDPNPSNWSFNSGAGICPEVITIDNVAFGRSVQFQTISTGKKLVTVIATWVDSGGTEVVKNQTFFTNWCQGQLVGGSPCPSP